ncbi:MAG: hypothetical protein RIR52_1973, partial [Acidobacteriota bacterium]
IEEHLNVVDQTILTFSGVDGPLEAGAVLENFLGFLLVVPEIWCCDLGFDVNQLSGLSGDVKETSAVPRPLA